MNEKANDLPGASQPAMAIQIKEEAIIISVRLYRYYYRYTSTTCSVHGRLMYAMCRHIHHKRKDLILVMSGTCLFMYWTVLARVQTMPSPFILISTTNLDT